LRGTSDEARTASGCVATTTRRDVGNDDRGRDARSIPKRSASHDAQIQSWHRRSAVYHQAMSRRTLLESLPAPNAGTEDDVEPYFPEPLIELDLDTIE